MSICITFKFLQVSTVRETGDWKGISKSNSLREETIKVEGFLASMDLYSEGVGIFMPRRISATSSYEHIPLKYL